MNCIKIGRKHFLHIQHVKFIVLYSTTTVDY